MAIDDLEFADLIEEGREPTRQQLAALMRRYLSEPVHEETVERLNRQFRELLSDEERRTTEELAFRASGRRYLGQAWKERLSPHERLPPAAELALWLAIVTPGYPRPIPYCPAEFAGSWTSNTGARWSLDRSGAFSTNEAPITREKVVRWCVHLVARKGDFRRDELWLFDTDRHNTSPRALIIRECSPQRLRLLWPGGNFDDIEFQLKRDPLDHV